MEGGVGDKESDWAGQDDGGTEAQDSGQYPRKFP